MEPFENDFPRTQDLYNTADLPTPQEPDELPSADEMEAVFAEATKAAEDAAQQLDSSYHGKGTGFRESPFADSPYAYTAPGSQSAHKAQKEPSFQPPAPPKPPKTRKIGDWQKRAISAALTAALVAGGCMITASSVNSKWEKKNAQTVTQMNEKIDALKKEIQQASQASGASVSGSTVAAINGLTPSQVYAQNVRSVVAISSVIRSTSFYGQTTQGTATGSGFILTENGYVVTNYHVVEGAVSVSVLTNDGEEYEATVVGHDAANDVAVLKVEAEGLPAVTIGSSEDLIIGDMVVAIGNPLGQLTATQTVGYVSGKNREVTTDNNTINMIQTDAAINSGNSGGPLFNMKGEVVGITTAKYSGTTNSGATIEGIGFAIPIDDVLNIIGDLRDFGYVTGAYLGVTVQNTDAESASMYGLPTGAYVVTTVADGSADRAGVRPKDIIIGLGEYEVSNVNALTRALRHFKAGDTTQIKVIRAGQTLTFDITLDEKPRDLNADTGTQNSVPQDGNYDEWYDYFRRYFGQGD